MNSFLRSSFKNFALRIPADLQKKWTKLLANLRAQDSLLVAFSGGVDSSLLLRASIEALGARDIVAVCCIGLFTPPWELNQARILAATLGIKLIEKDIDELSDPLIAINNSQRCYYCKRRRLIFLNRLAKKLGFKAVVEGSQLDDKFDFRPGTRAIIELGVLSPLTAAGLNKSMIRRLSYKLGLTTIATMPSSACLASRIPTNQPLTIEALERICKAENELRKLIPGYLRVRDHFPLARLEIEIKYFAMLMTEPIRSKILAVIKEVGYKTICLDLAGYKISELSIS